jgi:hypothetical protein
MMFPSPQEKIEVAAGCWVQEDGQRTVFLCAVAVDGDVTMDWGNLYPGR